MAKRRMFSIPLMEADSFYELSALSQALYFHLNLNADDDGLVDNVRSVMRDLKATKNNLRQLIDEGYLIELNKKVVAITHWNQHNRIKSDRYTKTTYGELMSTLRRDENDRYFKASEVICGDICAPQDSIGKDSIVKDSTVKISTDYGSIAEHSEEKKRNNLSLLHTDLQAESASQNNERFGVFSDICSSSYRLSNAFKTAITLHFMKKYQTMDISGFLDYCESRNWVGDNGESMKENYREYADRWMSEQEAFR